MVIVDIHQSVLRSAFLLQCALSQVLVCGPTAWPIIYQQPRMSDMDPSSPSKEAASGSMPQAASLRRRYSPFLIGVAGGTASGKTTVCNKIMHRLNDQCVALIHQDSFYRGLTEAEIADVTNYNFDHPDAFDHEALMKCLMELKAGRSVEVPIYDFTKHARSSEVRKVEPADVVMIEGILALHVPELREILNMKVYVDTDDDVRLARRIQRDVECRGRNVGSVIDQYTRFVKPSFDQFVAPSRRYADVIIPWQRGDNIVAIDLITEHIKTKMQQHTLRRIYPNLDVIPSNYQIRGMHTIIRDATTKANDFVFYADRINRLVVEAGLGLLPFSEKTVTTPTGHKYVGVEFARKLCGVSIIRSGESMESALRTCCKGIKIGKILVVRHHGHPQSGTTSGGTTPYCTSPLYSSAAGATHQTAFTPSAPTGAAAFTPAINGSRSSSLGTQGLPHTPAAAAAAAGGDKELGTHSPVAGVPTTPKSGNNSRPNSSRDHYNRLGRSTDGGALAAAAAAFKGMNISTLNPTQDVIYEKLPADIAERHVLLMDPVLSTGNSACRAIEVLLNRGVREEKIFLLSIIAAPEGISRVCSKFPACRVITSEIDDHIDEQFCVVPGCGEFGDRYFCD